MAQLSQGFGLDLADSLARDGERLAHFLEGMFAAVVEAKAHFNHLFLARRQGFQHGGGLFLEAEIDHRVGGGDHGLVFDEIAEMRIFFFTDRSFERDRLLRDLQNLSDFRDRKSTRLNSSHMSISYAVFCLKKK